MEARYYASTMGRFMSNNPWGGPRKNDGNGVGVKFGSRDDGATANTVNAAICPGARLERVPGAAAPLPTSECPAAEELLTTLSTEPRKTVKTLPVAVSR